MKKIKDILECGCTVFKDKKKRLCKIHTKELEEEINKE